MGSKERIELNNFKKANDWPILYRHLLDVVVGVLYRRHEVASSTDLTKVPSHSKEELWSQLDHGLAPEIWVSTA